MLINAEYTDEISARHAILHDAHDERDARADFRWLLYGYVLFRGFVLCACSASVFAPESAPHRLD